MDNLPEWDYMLGKPEPYQSTKALDFSSFFLVFPQLSAVKAHRLHSQLIPDPASRVRNKGSSNLLSSRMIPEVLKR